MIVTRESFDLSRVPTLSRSSQSLTLYAAERERERERERRSFGTGRQGCCHVACTKHTFIHHATGPYLPITRLSITSLASTWQDSSSFDRLAESRNNQQPT
jgi:hypothetical protein